MGGYPHLLMAGCPALLMMVCPVLLTAKFLVAPAVAGCPGLLKAKSLAALAVVGCPTPLTVVPVEGMKEATDKIDQVGKKRTCVRGTRG